METSSFITFDKKTVMLHIWDEVESPRGIVQILHGMAEHSERYAPLAEYLNSIGLITVSADHRSHGKNCPSPDAVGRVDGDIFEQVLHDQSDITDMLIQRYQGLPIYIFAHSFGSFVAQKYIQLYGDKIAAVVLSGSNRIKPMLLKFGLMLAKNRMKKKGADYISPMILKSGLKKYGKRFGGGNNWLTSVVDEVAKYDADEYCGRDFPCGFYYYFFQGMAGLYTKEGLNAIPKDLPILLLSGGLDPVGDYGKGVKRLYKTYKDLNLKVAVRLFENGRHEMLNEEERQEVCELIGDFFVS